MPNPGARLVGLQRCVIVSYRDEAKGVIHVPDGTSAQVVDEFRSYMKRRKRNVDQAVAYFQKRYPNPVLMRDSRS